MPKSEIKKTKSEDLMELSDEALDRAENTLCCPGSGSCPLPAE